MAGNMEERDLICIGCPKGCHIHVKMENGKVTDVAGNTCKIGDNYARKEVTNPTRIVTSIVEVTGGEWKMASVKTKSDIPKNKIFDVARSLKNLKVEAPIKVGDVIVKNVADTGVDIVATRNVRKI